MLTSGNSDTTGGCRCVILALSGSFRFPPIATCLVRRLPVLPGWIQVQCSYFQVVRGLEMLQYEFPGYADSGKIIHRADSRLGKRRICLRDESLLFGGPGSILAVLSRHGSHVG